MTISKSIAVSAAVAVVSACSEPTALPDAPGLVLAAASPTSAVVPVGSVLTDYPAVLVHDANGNPAPNISVTFRIAGGGFLAGSIIRTNEAGIARPFSWTLSTVPGRNTVTASIDTHTELVFDVQGVTGPPAQVIKVTGDQQVALRETAVPVRPSVRVGDRFGNPVAGVQVTFSVASGGGSITGAAVSTDDAGVARLGGWTVGRAGGQSVKASVDSMAVFFTAVIRPESLACLQSYTIAPILRSELDANGSCATDGHLYEAWVVDLDRNAWEFKLEAAEFDPLLELRDSDGQLIAINDNAEPLVTTSRFRVLLPPGRYIPVATTAWRGDGGPYTLSHSPTGIAADCGDTFVTRGFVALQEMISKQCTPGTQTYDDQYRIYLQAHSTLRVSIDDWSYADPKLEILDADKKVIMTGTQDGFYVDRVVFEAPADGFYTIKVSAPYEELIRYTLTIN